MQLKKFNIFYLLNPAGLVYKMASKAKKNYLIKRHMIIEGVIKTTNVFKKVMPDFNKILGTGIVKTMKY